MSELKNINSKIDCINKESKEIDSLICSKCKEKYDDGARIPKLLSTCSHTFCFNCILQNFCNFNNIVNNQDFKVVCFKCSKVTFAEKIEDLSNNNSLLSIIKERVLFKKNKFNTMKDFNKNTVYNDIRNINNNNSTNNNNGKGIDKESGSSNIKKIRSSSFSDNYFNFCNENNDISNDKELYSYNIDGLKSNIKNVNHMIHSLSDCNKQNDAGIGVDNIPDVNIDCSLVNETKNSNNKFKNPDYYNNFINSKTNTSMISTNTNNNVNNISQRNTITSKYISNCKNSNDTIESNNTKLHSSSINNNINPIIHNKTNNLTNNIYISTNNFNNPTNNDNNKLIINPHISIAYTNQQNLETNINKSNTITTQNTSLTIETQNMSKAKSNKLESKENKETKLICLQHGKELDGYCISCTQLICINCILENEHKSHQLTTISRAHSDYVNFIHESSIEMIKTEMNISKTLNKIEDEISKLNEIHYTKQMLIKKFYNRVKSVLEEREETLLNRLNRTKEKELEKYASFQKGLNKQENLISSFKEKKEIIIKGKNEISNLSSSREIKNIINIALLSVSKAEDSSKIEFFELEEEEEFDNLIYILEKRIKNEIKRSRSKRKDHKKRFNDFNDEDDVRRRNEDDGNIKATTTEESEFNKSSVLFTDINYMNNANNGYSNINTRSINDENELVNDNKDTNNKVKPELKKVMNKKLIDKSNIEINSNNILKKDLERLAYINSSNNNNNNSNDNNLIRRSSTSLFNNNKAPIDAPKTTDPKLVKEIFGNNPNNIKEKLSTLNNNALNLNKKSKSYLNNQLSKRKVISTKNSNINNANNIRKAKNNKKSHAKTKSKSKSKSKSDYSSDIEHDIQYMDNDKKNETQFSIIYNNNNNNNNINKKDLRLSYNNINEYRNDSICSNINVISNNNNDMKNKDHKVFQDLLNQINITTKQISVKDPNIPININNTINNNTNSRKVNFKVNEKECNYDNINNEDNMNDNTIELSKLIMPYTNYNKEEDNTLNITDLSLDFFLENSNTQEQPVKNAKGNKQLKTKDMFNKNNNKNNNNYTNINNFTQSILTMGASLYKISKQVIYIIGGKSDKNTYKYDIDSNTFSENSYLLLEKSDFKAIPYKSKALILGGKRVIEKYEQIEDSILSFDTCEESIRSVNNKLKSPRVLFGAVYSNSKLYVAGGFNGKDTLNTLEYYSKNSGKWEDLGKMRFKRKELCMELALDGCLYVMGGSDDKE